MKIIKTIVLFLFSGIASAAESSTASSNSVVPEFSRVESSTSFRGAEPNDGTGRKLKHTISSDDVASAEYVYQTRKCEWWGWCSDWLSTYYRWCVETDQYCFASHIGGFRWDEDRLEYNGSTERSFCSSRTDIGTGDIRYDSATSSITGCTSGSFSVYEDYNLYKA